MFSILKIFGFFPISSNQSEFTKAINQKELFKKQSVGPDLCNKNKQAQFAKNKAICKCKMS